MFNERVVTVKGTALGAGHLLLNGRAILTNEKGEFSETYVLAPGVNDIEIRARDRFGHEETVRRMVFLK
ncbi:hypothetical protein HYW53_01810 [Candidatus Giovannonibacteria bacterium]|nr:hypothetical protein [Candidatus Giovannonibacteria bacterium]